MTQSFAAGSYSVPVSAGLAASQPPAGAPPSYSPEPTGKHAPDLVNQPPHYKCPNPRYSIEAIDVIKAWLLHRDHYLANAVKYILRAPYKGHPVQDISKAVWYLNQWLETQREETGQA